MTGKTPEDTAHPAAAPEHDGSLTSLTPPEGAAQSTPDDASVGAAMTDKASISEYASVTEGATNSDETLPSNPLKTESTDIVDAPEETPQPENSSFDISSLAFDASALAKESSTPSSDDGNQQQKDFSDSVETDASENSMTASVTTTAAGIVANSQTETENEDETEEEEEEEKGSMTLRDHLRELRKRLFLALAWIFLGFLPCYAFGTKIFLFLKQPLINALPAGSDIIFTGVADGFFTELKISFLAGLFLASPMVFYQIWSFIAPGLYKEEKTFILPIAVFSSIFFIGGAAFCYYVTFPFAFRFFLSYNSEHMKAMLSATEYLGFSLQLLFAFGVVFELPVFTFFLSRIGLVTAALMRKFRRYAALVIIIIAAILTPPDVISQMMMAFPLLVLYEISILIAVVFGKKPPAPEEETAKAEEPA